jgi:MIP family channel proteins
LDRGLKSYAAEFLGTFALCFVGQGAVCTAQLTGSIGSALLPVALAHGLALAAMVSALGHVSGGHFNPAVTVGLAVAGRQKASSAVAYVVAQLVGAVIASLLLRAIFPASIWQAVRLGAGALSTELSTNAALLVEFVLTLFLVTVVWGTTMDERAPRIGGLAIGLAFTMGILVAGPLTGGIMNPARAFGAAFASAYWVHHWIFWLGPILGGIAAGLLYSRVLSRPVSAAE